MVHKDICTRLILSQNTDVREEVIFLLHIDHNDILVAMMFPFLDLSFPAENQSRPKCPCGRFNQY